MKKNINNNIKKIWGEGHRLLLERTADYRGEGGLIGNLRRPIRVFTVIVLCGIS